MGELGSLGIFLLVALFFPVMALGPGFRFQPKQPSPQKYIPYECGVDPIGSPYVQFRAGYFLYALLFIVFDIETVFLYPWAVEFQMLGLFALRNAFPRVCGTTSLCSSWMNFCVGRMRIRSGHCPRASPVVPSR